MNHQIAVLGAGSSGQAMAGFLAEAGYGVRLWNRPDEGEVHAWLTPIAQRGTITLRGAVTSTTSIDVVTTDLAKAIKGANVVLLTTTADAHRSVGRQLADNLDDQTIIIMSAGTFGALDLWRGLAEGGYTGDAVVAETSTTLFGSQAVGEGVVNISGRKRSVDVASLPSGHIEKVMTAIPEIPFVAAADVLATGLGNVGPCLHVAPMVLNAGWVEAQGGTFRYYRDGITPAIAEVAGQVDAERLMIARAFGEYPASLQDYLVDTVGAPTGSLYQSINGCTMYAEVFSPEHLNHRFLWEDTLAGAAPMFALAQVADVPAPTLSGLITLATSLLSGKLEDQGRTASNLGIEGRSPADLRQLITEKEEFDRWKFTAAAPVA